MQECNVNMLWNVMHYTNIHNANKHAVVFKTFGVGKIVLMLLFDAFIWSNIQKKSEIFLQFKIACFLCESILNCNLFLWSNLYFQHHYSVFSVTWSSEIIIICWFAAQETFMIIINVENSCAAQYFCGNWDTFILFFRIHRWIESSKEQHLK